MGLLKSAGTLTRKGGNKAGTALKPTYLAATESELSVPEKFEIQNVVKDGPIPEQQPAGLARCEIQCTFVGDPSTGKNTLLKAMGRKEKMQTAVRSSSEGEIFERYCARLTSRSGEKVNVKYCKASADEQHSRMRALCYQVTDVFFLCFSTTDRSSFESAKLEWFPEIDQLSPDAPVYLIGTKCDQRDREAESSSCVTAKEGHELADKLNAIMYIETQVNDRKDALMPVIKQVAEAVLRQVEHQRSLAVMNEEYGENEDNEPSRGGTLKKYASIRRKTRHSKKSNPISPKENHKRSVRLDAKRRKESFAVLTGSRRDSIAPRNEEDQIKRRSSRKRDREPLREKKAEPEESREPAKKRTRVSIMDAEIFDTPALDFCAIPDGDSLDGTAAVAKDVEEASSAEPVDVEETSAEQKEEPPVRVSLKKLRQALHRVARRTSARFQPILTRSTSSKKILTRSTSKKQPFPEVPLYTESQVNVSVKEAAAEKMEVPEQLESVPEKMETDEAMATSIMENVDEDVVMEEQAEPAAVTSISLPAAPSPYKKQAREVNEDAGDEDDEGEDDDDDYDESDDEAVFCNW